MKRSTIVSTTLFFITFSKLTKVPRRWHKRQEFARPHGLEWAGPFGSGLNQ
jgi:hypothetical protein